MATYISGNVVRKEPIVTQPSKQPVQKKHDKARQLNRGYVAFLAIASIVAMFMCVQYLRLQSEITQRSKHITSMQKDLANAKEANTTKYNAIINTMNLEEIRDIAMNEFGMVYAEAEQIITYQSPTGTTMLQYANIPEDGVVVGSSVSE